MGDSFFLLARDDSCDQTLTEGVSPVGAEDSQDPKVRNVMVCCLSRKTEPPKQHFGTVFGVPRQLRIFERQKKPGSERIVAVILILAAVTQEVVDAPNGQ